MCKSLDGNIGFYYYLEKYRYLCYSFEIFAIFSLFLANIDCNSFFLFFQLGESLKTPGHKNRQNFPEITIYRSMESVIMCNPLSFLFPLPHICLLMYSKVLFATCQNITLKPISISNLRG